MNAPNSMAEREYFGEQSSSVPREAFMFGHEMEREEALDLILFYAHQGRVKAALRDVRWEIIKHFDNRPDDGSAMQSMGMPWEGWESTLADWDDYRAHRISRGKSAHAEWAVALRTLLTLRRNIPKIAAEAVRRMPSYERENRVAFNRFFNNEAA